MPTGNVSTRVVLAGLDVSSTQTRTQEGQITQEVVLPVGKAGTLTTRTGDTSGEATLATGHGILTADVVDVFWEGGERHGMTVGTVAGLVVPVSGGLGTVLPAQTTALVVAKQVVINIDFSGDEAVIMLVNATQRVGVDFRDDADASLKSLALAAAQSWIWVSDTESVNPLAGEVVASMTASCGSTVASTLKIGILYSSVSP